jgi:hypothetical protein
MTRTERVHNTTAVDRVREDIRSLVDCLTLGVHDAFENSTGYLPELRLAELGRRVSASSA